MIGREEGGPQNKKKNKQINKAETSIAEHRPTKRQGKKKCNTTEEKKKKKRINKANNSQGDLRVFLRKERNHIIHIISYEIYFTAHTYRNTGTVPLNSGRTGRSLTPKRRDRSNGGNFCISFV